MLSLTIICFFLDADKMAADEAELIADCSISDNSVSLTVDVGVIQCDEPPGAVNIPKLQIPNTTNNLTS